MGIKIKCRLGHENYESGVWRDSNVSIAPQVGQAMR